MKLPEYISNEEVQRVCSELGIRDWTKLDEAEIELAEARKIQQEIGAEAIQIDAVDFQKGLEIELEHGVTFPDANVTSNHPILTGLIVLAHLKEMLDYYERLEVAELEGDMLKALEAGDNKKLAHKYRLLIEARAHLANKELARLGQLTQEDV
ncbi:MAG: DUF5661 family protein [Anaerolineae bacterium]